MKKLSLQVRITIVSAMVLTAIAAILTIIAVKNAQQTYTNEFELNIGDDFSIRYNDDSLSIDSNEDDYLNGVFNILEQFDDNNENEPDVKNNKADIFGKAGKEFSQKSLGVMVIFVIIGIIITYFLVRKALSPVRKLSQIVKETNENNLYKKIDGPVANDEIGSLTSSFNDMMERLNLSFTMQKNFAANAAHELRTPLSTMKAGIQVLEMDEEPLIEDYKETIEVVKKNTERMIQIVNDLLNLTRNEQCDFNNPIELIKLFHEIEEELTQEANKSKVSIILEQCDGFIKGNETLIYRALFNLVENAIKYNRAGGSVFIRSEMNETLIKITISDNGIGIPKDSLEHIFEPFYRVDKARSRAIGGSGLGLAIVKDIIDRHNGHMTINSTEGFGTTFVIEFPKMPI